MEIINGIIQGEPEIVAIVVSTIIIGIVELTKKMGVPTRFVPLVALSCGIILSAIYLGGEDIKKGILIGIWLGLGALGLHTGIKHTVEGKNNSE